MMDGTYTYAVGRVDFGTVLHEDVHDLSVLGMGSHHQGSEIVLHAVVEE
jgi:hypothetical protein